LPRPTWKAEIVASIAKFCDVHFLLIAMDGSSFCIQKTVNILIEFEAILVLVTTTFERLMTFMNICIRFVFEIFMIFILSEIPDSSFSNDS